MASDHVHQVTSKDEVVQDSILLAEELWQLASMAHGPHGQFIVVQANKDCGDAFIITSSAKRILDHIKLKSPMGTLVAQFVQSHINQCHDGGLFCIMLASSLLRSVHNVLQGIPKHRLVSGFRLALDWTLDELDGIQENDLDWSDHDAIVAVLRGILSAKHVAAVPDAAMAMLVHMFVHHIPWLLEHPTVPPLVRVVVSRPQLPHLTDHMILHHTVLIPGYRHVTHLPLRHVTVALFNVTIRPTTTPTSDIEVTIKVDSGTYHSVMTPSAAGVLQEAELTGWATVATRLQACGVQMVLSQKKIPAFLAARLNDLGIASVERLSIQHLDAVQAVTGAAVLSDWMATDVTAADLGKVDHAYALELGGVEYVALTCDPASHETNEVSYARTRPMSTIKMDCIDDMAFEELNHVLQAAIHVLTNLLVDPSVCAGAGDTERALVRQLRRRAVGLTAVDSRDRAECRGLKRVVDSFVDALERCTLPEQQKGSVMPDVLDSAAVKTSAIVTAVTLVTTLLRVDGVIVAGASSNPK
ncbi:hypothetical protein, variant 3 [Aphanomyces astaci]|uniref:Uncharacterized protein n=1 Tax=Aphanomyces astaci TaxID=112090 RepID=W4GR23_APHAT|nr:hypothetical protein, variant 3 [Aphanomyces astaci]ETV81791.1 hypothetical protein, variant 3 [Aphanomyces astaci]|eukprot:XP_009828528.1 hypothetical protein, variant 3 [Aphanomyces astaci]